MPAYFDCFSGISGDMTLGALIDLGVPVKWLKETLENIPLTGFDLSLETVFRNGISAKNVYVHAQDCTSKDYAQIKAIIRNSPLSANVQETTLEIFERIAVAEARIHGRSKEKVHFHETGGIDAIVDIAGTALCIEYLSINKVIASRLPLGTGFVSCRHGILPVPVPATLAILKGIPVYGSGIAFEQVTPTGAAIIATLAESFGDMPEMIIEKTGYGAGKRELESVPNLLRVITGTLPDVISDTESDTVVVVKTCIDDMNPEIFGFVMDRLFADGALDVYSIPVFMKKNRPGTMLEVLCDRSSQDAVIRRILSETTSLGVRYYEVKRRLLYREHVNIKTSYGVIAVKRIKNPDGGFHMVPEYEVCKKIALEKNIPLKVVYNTIEKEAALNL